MPMKPIEPRVVGAAEATLADKGWVAPIDILLALGWLAPARVDEWRQGRVTSLERVTQANLHKLSEAMHILRSWANERRLQASETAYVARTRNRRVLRFSVSGDPDLEAAYGTRWVSPDLSEAKRRRREERQSDRLSSSSSPPSTTGPAAAGTPPAATSC